MEPSIGEYFLLKGRDGQGRIFVVHVPIPVDGQEIDLDAVIRSARYEATPSIRGGGALFSINDENVKAMEKGQRREKGYIGDRMIRPEHWENEGRADESPWSSADAGKDWPRDAYESKHGIDCVRDFDNRLLSRGESSKGQVECRKPETQPSPQNDYEVGSFASLAGI